MEPLMVWIGALGFWPLTVYFPVEMYISQKKIPKWSNRWISLKIFSMACLIVSVVVDDFDGTFMVMEHMEYDLKGLTEVKKHPFSMSEIKSLVRQLLEGVKYLFHVGFIFLDQPFTYFSLFFSFH